jgi:hypothetical protein
MFIYKFLTDKDPTTITIICTIFKIAALVVALYAGSPAGIKMKRL